MEPLVGSSDSSKGLRTMNLLSLTVLLIFYILIAVFKFTQGIYLAIYIFSIIFACSNILFLVLPQTQKMIVLRYRIYTVYLWALLLTVLSIVEIILVLINDIGFFGLIDVNAAGYYILSILFAVAVMFNVVTYTILIRHVANMLKL